VSDTARSEAERRVWCVVCGVRCRLLHVECCVVLRSLRCADCFCGGLVPGAACGVRRAVPHERDVQMRRRGRISTIDLCSLAKLVRREGKAK
jgi:hypothetical protein